MLAAVGRRNGTTDLPLHGGRVPPWLARRAERSRRVDRVAGGEPFEKLVTEERRHGAANGGRTVFGPAGGS